MLQMLQTLLQIVQLPHPHCIAEAAVLAAAVLLGFSLTRWSYVMLLQGTAAKLKGSPRPASGSMPLAAQQFQPMPTGRVG